jgi:putative OPT family oligopeptide transporter
MNGPRSSELSVRAVAAGVFTGCLIGASNVCVGLKIGLAFGATLTTAVVAFALVKALSRASAPAFTPRENVISSTAGSAAAAMASAAGLISFIPALEMLGTPLSYWELVLWATATAGLGVFFTVPLRRSMVVVEKLRYPTGTATAETISAMFARSDQAVSKARVLFYAALAAGTVTLLFSIKPLQLGRFQNFGLDDLGLSVGILGVSAAALKLGVSCSPMILGAGVLVGPRVGWSLLLGSVVAWMVCAPLLIHSGVVTPEQAGREYAAAFRWLLWPGVSLMVFAGLTGLLMRYRTILRTFSTLARGSKSGADAPDPFPLRLWLIGLLLFTGGVVVLCWFLFGITPWMALLAILLSFIFCAIAVRAVGETDMNPSGPMAKITQVIYGFLDPGRVTTNVMTAGITAAGASQAADLMSDLKAGHLLGASVRRQVFAQLLGIGCGVFVVVGVYKALAAAYPIPGEDFTAPAVQSWYAVARVLADGLASLPAGTAWAAVAGGALGIALTLLGRIQKIAPFLPSPVALGIAFLVPSYYAWGIFLGALIAWAVGKRRPETTEKYATSLASGLIAGEGILMVLVAVLLILGVSWV